MCTKQHGHSCVKLVKAHTYNNTLAHNGTNIRIKDTHATTLIMAEIAAGITWIARDNVSKNNILSNATILKVSTPRTAAPTSRLR